MVRGSIDARRAEEIVTAAGFARPEGMADAVDLVIDEDQVYISWFGVNVFKEVVAQTYDKLDKFHGFEFTEDVPWPEGEIPLSDSSLTQQNTAAIQDVYAELARVVRSEGRVDDHVITRLLYFIVADTSNANAELVEKSFSSRGIKVKLIRDADRKSVV